MKEISAEFLRDEIVRLDAVVSETDVYHLSGVRLHNVGDTITLANAKLMYDLGIKKLALREPGEAESGLHKAIGVRKVEVAQVAPGDILIEEVRTVGGTVIAPVGAVLDEETVEKIRFTRRGPVGVRKPEDAGDIKQALEYLKLNPLAAGARGDTRMTRITKLNAFRLLPLLAPRARIFVILQEDFIRSLVTNTLLTAGHEATAFPSLEKSLAGEQALRPDLIVTDADSTQAVAAEYRKQDRPPKLMILSCVPEDRPAEFYKAQQAGANDAIPRPPRPEFLLDKVRGCLAVLSRKSRLTPVVQNDRRLQERTGCKGTCSLKDPAFGKPLPVVGGDIVDLSGGGLRMDYNLPQWPVPWAYVPGGVHPKHFFYGYAKGNPLGRDLILILESPGNAPVEAVGRVTHVSPRVVKTGDLEVLGIKFGKVGGPLDGFMSTAPIPY